MQSSSSHSRTALHDLHVRLVDLPEWSSAACHRREEHPLFLPDPFQDPSAPACYQAHALRAWLGLHAESRSSPSCEGKRLSPFRECLVRGSIGLLAQGRNTKQVPPPLTRSQGFPALGRSMIVEGSPHHHAPPLPRERRACIHCPALTDTLPLSPQSERVVMAQVVKPLLYYPPQAASAVSSVSTAGA